MRPTDTTSTAVLAALLALAGIAGVASFGTAGAAVTGSENVTVTDVVDGDTLDIRYENGSTDTVRLVGIDAPETSFGNQPYEYEGVPNDYFGSRCLDEEGEDASAFLTDRLEGETVTLYTGKGTDNRSAVYWGRSSEAWTGNGTVSLTAGGGELATTRLYNKSSAVANSD